MTPATINSKPCMRMASGLWIKINGIGQWKMVWLCLMLHENDEAPNMSVWYSPTIDAIGSALTTTSSIWIPVTNPWSIALKPTRIGVRYFLYWEVRKNDSSSESAWGGVGLAFHLLWLLVSFQAMTFGTRMPWTNPVTTFCFAVKRLLDGGDDRKSKKMIVIKIKKPQLRGFY